MAGWRCDIIRMRGRCKKCRHDAIGGTVAGELKRDVLQCSMVCHDRLTCGGRLARWHVIRLRPSTGRRPSIKGLHAVECYGEHSGIGWMPRVEARGVAAEYVGEQAV